MAAIAILVSNSILGCKPKAGPQESSPLGESRPNGIPQPSDGSIGSLKAPFDSAGPAVIGDFDGDSLYDTVRAVYLSGPIPEKYSILVPDSSGRPDSMDPKGWGLAYDRGANTGEGRNFFIPAIPSVIYNQGGPESVRVDSLPFPELKATVDPAVKDAISLYTEASINVFLYQSHGKLRVFWPDEED